jgi:DegV family protein with EDD domain
MSIAIVTDSTADIPYELADQHHIHIVPNTIVIDGQSMEDGRDLSRYEFYERLPALKQPPTTATASSGTYEALYEKLLAQGASHILSIHASSLLSGIYNAAHTAAQAFEGRVFVVDSELVSLGLGFQVLEAAEAVARNPGAEDVPADQVLKLLEDVRSRTRVVAMLDTLEYVRRSGRVSWARARLGEMLKIKAFIEVKAGKVLSLGETRTFRKGFDRLIELLHDLGPLERLAVLHTNAEEEAGRLLNELDPQLPTEPLIVNITTVIGAHVGPRCLGFVAVTRPAHLG